MTKHFSKEFLHFLQHFPSFNFISLCNTATTQVSLYFM